MFASLAVAGGCVFTDNGDDAETIGEVSQTGDASTGSDDGPSATTAGSTAGSTAGATTQGTTQATGDMTGDMTGDEPGDATDDATDGDSASAGETDDDAGDGSGEPPDPSECTPGANDSACEVCVATSCCDPFLDCSQGGSAFVCDCHTACLDEGYPAGCAMFCGPAPAEFAPLLACAQEYCAAPCGL